MTTILLLVRVVVNSSPDRFRFNSVLPHSPHRGWGRTELKPPSYSISIAPPQDAVLQVLEVLKVLEGEDWTVLDIHPKNVLYRRLKDGTFKFFMIDYESAVRLNRLRSHSLSHPLEVYSRSPQELYE